MTVARRTRAIGLSMIAAAYLLCATGAPASAADVPYSDARSKGTVGFCDASGHEVTSGKTTDRPFAPFVVSSYRPPAPYDQEGGTTWLLSYQPRKGVDPGNWSGFQLTASSTYTVAASPKAEVLPQDRTLAQAVANYPPQWDGILQLRMYFKNYNEPVFNGSYPSADIRISGDRWTLVRGGGISCTKSGEAKSVARTLIPEKLTSVPGVPDGTPSAPSSDTASSREQGGAKNASPRLAASSAKSSGPSWPLPVIAAGLLAIVVTSTFRVRKKLRP